MLISHILLRNFGRFTDFRCDFRPGLNIIKGPNEAGKSTLVNAITVAIFNDPQKEQASVAKATHWGSIEGPSMELLFAVDGTTYHLTKDFAHGQAELDSSGKSTEMNSGETMNQWLAEKMGMPSEEIFRSTSCIRQGEIGNIEDSIDAIKHRLESLVTGSREERAASEAINRLERRIGEICGTNVGSLGELANTKEMADTIDYQIQKLSQDIDLIRSKRADLIQVEMAYNNITEDLTTRRLSLEQGQKVIRLESEIGEYGQEFQDLKAVLDSAQGSLKKIKDLRERHGTMTAVDGKDVDQITRLESSLNYLNPKRIEMEAEEEKARIKFRSYKIGGHFILMAPLSLICAAFLIISHFLALAEFPTSIIWTGAGICSAIFIASLTLLIVRGQNRRELKQRLEEIQSQLTEIDFQIQNQSKSIDAILARYSMGSIEDLRRLLWTGEDIDKQVSAEGDCYEKNLAGRSLLSLERRYRYLEDILAKMTREQKELLGLDLETGALGRDAQIVGQIEERITELEQGRRVLQEQIGTAEGGSELLASYIERKQCLEARLQKLVHELEILRLTIDCINEARQNVLVSTLEVLNARTSDLLNKLTSGRHSRVRFDKATFKFEVFSEDKGDWLDPNSLSSGASDQVYLAARLALADLISQDKNSLMIFDDPFVNYDERRLENVMKVLKDLSRNHQILLLTSQSHYDKWADATIAL